MPQKVFPAKCEAFYDVSTFVEDELGKLDCSMKVMTQISVCVEEMFVNVAHYAYPDGDGDVTIGISQEGDLLTIILQDHGVPFDPLAKEDPDITLAAEERSIGGLGIFMVKRSMDHVSYDRRDGQNIFTMQKHI